MKTYLFMTHATMKEYNNDNYWIAENCIGPITLDAETVDTAIQRYAQIVQENHFVTISNNALKNKEPMFTDKLDGSVQQIGYIITGKTAFDYDRKYTEQYICLWVSIYERIQFDASL